MSTQTTDKPNAKTETFVVQQTEEGYRVFSPVTPAKQYTVTDDGEDITCTCPSFTENANIPNWRCNHIVAVIQFLSKQDSQSDQGEAGAAQPNGTPPPKEPPAPKKPGPKSAGAEASMLIKRSLSPDGRIDSLSVEFSVPVGKATTEEIKQQAERAMKLQAEIMHGFAKPNGNGARRNGDDPSAVVAQLLNIAAMDTKKGRSLFINVFVNNQVAKLFGEEAKLREALTAAGYSEQAAKVADGLTLNLPCRAVTKQNGKYLNIERLLPAPAANGGAS
jgi:hypothetical protein